MVVMEWSRSSLDVDPVLDDELQAGVADELGGSFDAYRPDAFYLTQLVALGGASLECLGVNDDDSPIPSARAVPSGARPSHQVKKGVETMSIEGLATGGPGGLPACFGVSLEAGAHLGPRHLVTQEFAPDATVLGRTPTEVPVGVDPGSPGPIALGRAGLGALTGGRSAELSVAGPSLDAEPVNRCETPMAQMRQMARGASSGRLIQKTSGIRGAWGGLRKRPGMAA
jgi:hypothetical protein